MSKLNRSAKPQTRKAPSKPKVVREAAPVYAVESKPSTRRPVNLTLDPEAIERAERFAAQHGVSVSTLVNGFLRTLPDESSSASAAAESSWAPAVQRLYGLLRPSSVSREDYHAHLRTKYGAR